jgi:hypothetical protein
MPRTRLLQLSLSIGPLLCGPADSATLQHFEPLRAMRMDAAAAAGPAATEPRTLHFNAFSRDFALELRPNGRLAGMQRQMSLGVGFGAYRGTVAGRAGSWARVVLTPAGPTGLVFDGETLYGLEVGTDPSAPRREGGAVMFRLADLYFAPGEIGTELDTVAIDGWQAVALMAEEFTALAAGTKLNLDLGAVADFEFSQTFGAQAETALLTRLNNVDGIYSEQLGVQITVAETQIFTIDNDPFTASLANELLEQLANYRGATPAQDARGLTHLFTGRDLEGQTAGIAYFGSVCARRNVFDSRSFGAALSEARRGAVVDSLVAAHEIGHNFGAPHDGDAAGACASTPTTFLMAPRVNGSEEFSSCSIEQIQREIAGASCLTPIGPANVVVTLPQPAQAALAAVAFDHTATVHNDGVDPASGVTFAAASEQGLEIVAVDAGGPSCSLAANEAHCSLGTVNGGVAHSVTLTLRAPSPGVFALTSHVAAEADDDATDNSATVAMTVVAGVDLVLSGTAADVALNAQTTIHALLENAADVAATSVAVAATLSAGLRPDQATLAGVACTVAAQTIACPPRALAARGSVTLAVTATGIAPGGQQLTVGATAGEVERTPADNQLAMAVSVNAPQRSDGGGGAVSWWFVVALLVADGARRLASPGRRRPCDATPPEA